jgi:hypothetical protein
MYGNLSAVEDEWHIRGIPEWIDPLFTFQRTWYPDDVADVGPNGVRRHFSHNVARVLAVIGGGLAGYYVWQKTSNRVYTGLAGAGGFVVAPMLLAAYEEFSRTTEEAIPVVEEDGEITNTYTPTEQTEPPNQTGTQTTPTLVPGSPQIKQAELAPNSIVPYKARLTTRIH